MQARTEEYARLLRRFSRAELEEAYTDVLQVWEFSSWPPPGRFFTVAMENRKRYRTPEHRPLNVEYTPGGMEGVSLAHVDALLNEYPDLSPTNRAALWNLAITMGAGVEGEDRSYCQVPEPKAGWKNVTLGRNAVSSPPEVLLNTVVMRQARGEF